MHLNRRRRLAGLLVALLASAGATAIALPAHALSLYDPNLDPCGVSGNVVANCGFEAPVSGSGVVPGWAHLVDHGGAVTHSGGKSGAAALVFASISGDDVWTQTVPVSPNTTYLVGAEFYSSQGSASSAQDDIALTATNVAGNSAGTFIYTSVNTDMGWSRGGTIVKTGAGHTMTLTLSGANVPSTTLVDDVFVLPQRAGCAAIANNLVKNCGFEAPSISPWAHSVGSSSGVTSDSNGGTSSLAFNATGTNHDTWSQVVSVRPHTQYSLTYWAEYWSTTFTPDNDLTVSVSNVPASGGTMQISTLNVPNHFWAQVTRTFTTGSGTTATVTITGRNSPAFSVVDDFSVTAVPHVKLSAKGHKLTTTLSGLGGQRVQVQRYVHKHWKVFASFTAPKTGWSTSWKITVPAGKYRAVAGSAPGYASTTSSSITVH